MLANAQTAGKLNLCLRQHFSLNCLLSNVAKFAPAKPTSRIHRHAISAALHAIRAPIGSSFVASMSKNSAKPTAHLPTLSSKSRRVRQFKTACFTYIFVTEDAQLSVVWDCIRKIPQTLSSKQLAGRSSNIQSRSDQPGSTSVRLQFAS